MTLRYNIHDAKTHFSKLVAAVERGERVTICRNGEPVIECRPAAKPGKAYPFGIWAEQASKRDLADMDRPTDPADLDEMGL
ncbi:MAG: type II toxin-antitoxin system prevent-host-death family antitoxin [Pseudomonadota bacterium]